MSSPLTHTTSSGVKKVHTAALCLIPPRSLWAPIQRLRVFRDKSFVRWPPHINLLYPFIADEGDGGSQGSSGAAAGGAAAGGGSSFEAAAHKAAEALAHIEPDVVTLRELSYFVHGGRSVTGWLQPESNALLRVQQALVEAFPSCTDLSLDPSRGIERFTPHLSIGQWRLGSSQQQQQQWRHGQGQQGDHGLQGQQGPQGMQGQQEGQGWQQGQQGEQQQSQFAGSGSSQRLEDVERELQRLQREWRPLSFPLVEVELISRKTMQGNMMDPFCIRFTVPVGSALRGSSSGSVQKGAVDLPGVQRINAPYIATVGPGPEEGRYGSLASSYGIGALQQQVFVVVLGPPAAAAAAPAAAASEEGGAQGGAAAAAAAAAADAQATAGAAQVQDEKEEHPQQGDLQQGVWNFAYGANMAPSKLNGARGLHPLRSVPAALPGWRVAFNHRGGMGNLVPTTETTAAAVAAAAGSSPSAAALPPAAAETAAAAEAAPEARGVLHLLSPADYAALACMEHEYLPLEVEAFPLEGSSSSGQPSSVTPVRAVAFVSPDSRCIADGLPPPDRYANLLREGARHWRLGPDYVSWLESLPTVPGNQRGDAYYTSPTTGKHMAALPKIRTGSGKRGGGGGGGKRGKGSSSGGGDGGRGGGNGGGKRRQQQGGRQQQQQRQ